MSAEPKEYVTVRLEMSERDRKDGISVTKGLSHKRVEKDAAKTFANVIWSDPSDAEGKGLVNFGKNSVAKKSDSKVTFQVLDGKDVLAEGNFAETLGTVALDRDLRVIVYVEYDVKGIDGQTGADGTDDRDQKTYAVHLETGIGSGYYKNMGGYTVNLKDDLVKLVTDGDYTGLPGLYDEKYDEKEDQIYVYQYTIDGEDIYAHWVKEGSPLFGKVEAEEEKEYDELDANKDGVVSCEEALGKGWVWNNETSACELKGSSNTGSYVPNTATK